MLLNNARLVPFEKPRAPALSSTFNTVVPFFFFFNKYAAFYIYVSICGLVI